MSWLEHAVMYQIFIDRFAGYDPKKDWQKPDFMGGNIRGIIDKFDYIKSLGVNTIWLSPFYKGTEFHGYEITDFFSVDERFGTEEDLQELITLAHTNGMKIIADIVPNHVSIKHPYFIDAQTNSLSPYRHWFLFTQWPNYYVKFLTFGNMPKLNLENKEALQHVQDSARKWLKMGLDGYRIDHIIGLSNKTVKKLFGPLKQEFPDTVYFGEAAMFGGDGNPGKSRSELRGVSTTRIRGRYMLWVLKHRGFKRTIRNYVSLLDGMLDFYFAHQISQFAQSTSESSREKIIHRLRTHQKSYPAHFSLVYFLDNHDLTRYLFRVHGDTKKLLDATRLMFSLKGAKVIYYGTEVGVTQDKDFLEMKEFGDIQARKPMPWNRIQQNTQLLHAFRQIIAESSPNHRR